MRTAGMVMGIVGGAISIIFALLLILGSFWISSFVPWMNSYDYDWDYNNNSDSDFDTNFDFDSDYNFDSNYDSILGSLDNYDKDLIQDMLPESEELAKSIVGTVFLVPGICAAIAGVLGLVGGLIIKKKNVAAGVLMIIAAVLSLFSFFNVISMALFILGGVFALMRDRKQAYAVPNPQAYAPYPPQPYVPYPPQQIPQQYPDQQIPQQPAPPQNPPENPQP